jgi:hypothetical protein
MTMLIPVDGRDLGLPDDVVELAKTTDLVELQEVPSGSHVLGRPSWHGLGNFRSALAEQPSFPVVRDDEIFYTRAEPMRVPKLENWTVQADAYTTDVAGKVSLLGRLFSGEIRVANAGVVHEAKRFTVQRTSQDRFTEFGVSVRIIAATTDWDSKLQLTLPNLAADAQLNRRDARVAIEVVGYSGPLGSLLPAPERLDVESFAVYLHAFNSIQAAVFGEAGLPYLTPALLTYDDSPAKASSPHERKLKS